MFLRYDITKERSCRIIKNIIFLNIEENKTYKATIKSCIISVRKYLSLYPLPLSSPYPQESEASTNMKGKRNHKIKDK